MAPQQGELRDAYEEYLRRTGCDLKFEDHAPKSMTSVADPFARGSFDPKAAKAVLRVLEASRRYTSWPTIGAESQANYLYRLGTVRRREGPYLGDRLPYLQGILDHMGPALLDAMKLTEERLPFGVFFGLDPTGEFNARVEPVAGGALVLIDAGAMDLLFTVLKINLAASGDTQDPPKLNEFQTVLVLTEAFNAYFYGEFSLQAWALPRLDPHREELLWYVLRAGEEFMLAHELGHIVRGHVRLPANAGAKAVVQLTPEAEFEADEFAVDLLVRGFGLEPNDPKVQFLAGGMLNFLTLEFTLSLIAKEFQIAQVSDQTHPAVEARWNRLGVLLNKRFPKADPLERGQRFQKWLDVHYLGPIVATLRLVDKNVKRPPKYIDLLGAT